MKNYIGKDFYKLLGISYDASIEQIKAAYRKLVKVHHPDANKGNKESAEKFKELQEAYEVLSSPEKKKQYDIMNGHFKKNHSLNQAKAQAKKAYSEDKKTAQKDEKMDKKPSFSEIFEGFWSSSKPPQKKGSDIFLDVELSSIEASEGVVKQINIIHQNPCPKCTEKLNPDCILCGGTNEVPKHEKVRVKIPPKVKENMKVRIKNEGNKGLNGGKNGDLILRVKIKSNKNYTYQGDDILYTLPVTPTEAALGASIKVPIENGDIVVKLPPETSSGQKLKMANEGLKNPENGKKGDMILTVKIVIPKNLSEKEKALYKELSAVREFNPRENEVKNG